MPSIVDALSQIWYFLWIYIPGWLLTLVSRVLVWVLSYQNFANETIINRGWTVTRDLSNLFFIIVLLVIALGTILRSSRYGYQQNLRRLVLMAILINFSKTIALFFIEVSQAVTLAFVNAFLNSLQAGFPQLLGLTPVMTLVSGTAGQQFVGGLSVFVQIMMGGIMMVVALIVVIIISLIFLFRLIAFAFIIILAPVAFLLSAWPTGFTYYQRWWRELGNYAAVGPALAFFLWLSFSVVQPNSAQPTPVQGCLSQQLTDTKASLSVPVVSEGATDEEMAAAKIAAGSNTQNAFVTETTGSGDCPTASGNPLVATLLRFFVGISLLIGGLKVAQELGVAGAGMANQWSGKMTNFAKGTALGIGAAAGFGVAALGGKVGRKIGSTQPMQNLRENINAAMATKGGRVLGGAVKYAGGGFVYSQVGQAATRKYRQAKAERTAKYNKDMTYATDQELERAMNTPLNPEKAQAAAMMLDKRHGLDQDQKLEYDTDEKSAYMKDLKKKEALRNKVHGVLSQAGEGDPAHDHYEEFQKKYPDAGGDLAKTKETIRGVNTAGDFEKFAARWNWTPQLMRIAREAGITNKQLAALAPKMTDREKKNYGVAVSGAANLADAGGDENIKERRELRTLGAQVDSKNIERYVSTDKVKIKVIDANGKETVKDDQLMTMEELVGKLTPEQAAGIHIDSIEAAAPHMTSNQFIQMARTGDPEKTSRAKAAAISKLRGKIDTAGGLNAKEQKLAKTLLNGDYIGTVAVSDDQGRDPNDPNSVNDVEAVTNYFNKSEKPISKESVIMKQMVNNLDEHAKQEAEREKQAAAGSDKIDTEPSGSSSGGSSEAASGGSEVESEGSPTSNKLE
ncbi:MAG: hypothetical protein V1846_01630 [Candidatus Komeilibacteria bacterium]